ncbi:cell division protein FtsA [Pelotomaculum propionicicum]|uniref:Cell division protein FtsA n=1 Tax=Pelotomaculum propionicicum TaxID=258475 RepID=A0A4Y7RWS7_9FIRM|nr:cell division protein FtsA [Pelotomaculum propionicicum]NLI12898.1 cell division protein FtsA [Peptococcaceae bacterium]TEB13142.1 Cell division protein FtsA [Pelotomaculum propionicicum]
MAKGNPVVLAGLDLGTSKTAVAIAAVKNASLELLGLGESPSIGVQKGIVTDTESAARSVRQALEKAEKMAGLKIDYVYLSFNGAGVKVRGCCLENPAVDMPAGSAKVYPNAVHDIPAVTGIPHDEELLQIIPPRTGLIGFGREARAITARSRDLEQLTRSVRLAGLESKGIIYGPLAAAEALLLPSEREFGAVLADIGAGLTSVSVFDRCLLRETAVFPLGGEHLTSDLAIGLRTTLGQAQEILQAGCLGEDAERSDNRDLTVEQAGPVTGERDQLARSIIKARAEEIIDLISASIREFDYPGTLPGGVIFSGGVASLAGLAKLAEDKLQQPVKTRTAPQDVAAGPAYAGALGLLRCAYRHADPPGKNFSKGGLKESAAKILDWFHVQLNDYKAGQSKKH